ncbi:MAG TPA: 1,4-alpha-glucan branching protein GlgB [Candidatus Izemoplasmatales bacterium]|nr:1,4-alpha-glucan branching protein GlgB [Candidatus Izemoplasmatales bacterium]
MKINGETMYLFDNGELLEAYKHFGAHVKKNKNNNVIGVRFTVFAPHARIASVVGDFNHWDSRSHTMTKIDDSGVFSIYIEGLSEWERYKYCFVTHDNETIFKSDPYAFFSDFRPETSSKVYDLDGYLWQDQDYMNARKHRNSFDEPMVIYEMHVGSWMRKPDWTFNKYNELVDLLIPYLKENGFTHVEMMPLVEHPLDESWGYQATGYYAATSRFGVPKDLFYLIDRLHQEKIGVILDWVPSHISKDAHGLYRFDGSYLYEYGDDTIRENKVWGTINLDLGKGIVRSFLLSNARFWMDYFHIDGFRIDAVSNILHYLGDPTRGTNDGALEFLKRLSLTVKDYDSSVLLFAEDSSTFPKLTTPVKDGGVGFDYKWNMGWMNDTLRYFEKDPIYRKYHQHFINFAMVYHHSERFVLALSHDEVVHGKHSLVEKMPGDNWQQFANYRLLVGLQMTHPGKKLMFMGNEFGQMHEWRDKGQLDWHLYQYPSHQNANKFFKDMVGVYHDNPCFYERDYHEDGFRWVDQNNSEQSIFSFIRYDANGGFCLVILNMTPMVYHDYRIGVPAKGRYKEIMNSDWEGYEGSNTYNGDDPFSQDLPDHGFDQSIQIVIAPLAIQIFKLRE